MTDRGAVEVAATASTTAREARRTSNMSVSQSSEDLVPGMRDRWRTVLTRANQELLRELAKHAATQGADGAGGMPIETIMDVAVEKVLADVPFLQHMATPVADGPEVDEGAVGVKEITEPQLDDIKAVPWNVWSRSDVVNAPPTDSPLGFEGCEQFFPRLGSFNRTASQDATTMTAGLRLLPTTRQHTMMRWSERPKTVMIVAKQGDLQVTRTLREMAVWLDSQKVTVVLEPELMAEIHRVTAASSSDAETGIERSGSASSLLPYDRPASTNNAENHKWEWDNTESLPSGFVSRLRTWTPNVDRLERRIDLLICVGGDGTLCWSAGLFPEAMPPVIAFAGGSLGFLTPFPMQDWMAALVPMIYVAPPAELRQHRLTCRMRFQMRVLRANKKRDIEGVPLAEAGRDHEISHWVPLQALNEVLLHRGSNPSLVKLDVTVGKTPITLVQGDGLILATPTGSTAYSLAAGGSIVHPSVPGIILTPVCPHSLSFRPVVLPDSAVVKIKVPKGARTYQVMVAVDGKEVIELNWGDSLEVSVSPYPMPTICKESETDDWFRAVNGGLRWNLRSEQKGVNP